MKINLLVCLDENYLPQLRIMLASLTLNNPDVKLCVYLLHSGIPEQRLANVRRGLAEHGHVFCPILVDGRLFAQAFKDTPVKRYYSQEMFYRLLAGEILPKTVDRVLYLDPDILIINSISRLPRTPAKASLLTA